MMQEALGGYETLKCKEARQTRGLPGFLDALRRQHTYVWWSWREADFFPFNLYLSGAYIAVIS